MALPGSHHQASLLDWSRSQVSSLTFSSPVVCGLCILFQIRKSHLFENVVQILAGAQCQVHRSALAGIHPYVRLYLVAAINIFHLLHVSPTFVWAVALTLQ